MLNEMSNAFQKALKIINMYEINQSGCQVPRRGTKDLFFQLDSLATWRQTEFVC